MTSARAWDHWFLNTDRELGGMRDDVNKALTEIKVMEAHRQSATATDADHEARLRTLAENKADSAELAALTGRVGALERFRWQLGGMVIVTNLIIGVVGYWVGHVLR